MNALLRDPSPLTLNSFVTPTSCLTPELITISAWLEHAPFGFWIVEALRPRTIVELGVHHGFSYAVFCQAVQHLRLATRCFAIDTWLGDQHAGFYGDEVYAAVCSQNSRYDGFSMLIRSDFADACGEFADGSIDLLHIDGCHTYEAVRRDFESWLPKVSQRGVILFHDIAEYENEFGVYRLWDELCARYPHFDFRHGHGLGIIAVGDRIPARISELLQASGTPSAQAIRTVYERLGGLISTQHALHTREREIETLRLQVEDLEARADAYEASTCWRLTAPLRNAKRLMQSANTAAGDLRERLSHAASPAPGRPVYRADH